MTLLDYLLPLLYWPMWKMASLLGRAIPLAFYAADPLDYEMFLPIQKHLKQTVECIAANSKTAAYFKKNKIPFRRYPAFPRAVIMGRHEAYKFPVKKMIRIGFDHGLYQFKRWTSPRYYNQFDVYFVSSEHQAQIAAQKGIRTVRAVGYPKLDKAFDGSIGLNDLRELKKKLGLDSAKPTIIFTSTWDVGGLSAITRWIGRVGELTERYNILLTAHPWTKPRLLEQLKRIPGTFFLQESDVTPYLMLSDVFVGDYNSLIGEFCALDKPIITFRVRQDSSRALPEVQKMIADISLQVDSFDEIPQAIEHCLRYPNEKQAARQKANRILFMALDGQAGKRAADIIETFFVAIK